MIENFLVDSIRRLLHLASARRHKVAMQHVVGARAVGRHPHAMKHLPAVRGQDEARHEADDCAVRTQRWQVENHPFAWPGHLSTKQSGYGTYLSR